MRTLRFTANAREDIAHIYRFIESQTGNIDLAESFARRLNQQCRKLAELPARWESRVLNCDPTSAAFRFVDI